MRLEKMEHGAYEATWKKDGDRVEVDYLKACIPFSGSEQLELDNIVDVHKFDVRYGKIVKRHFFKENEYGNYRHLHVLAIERKKNGKNAWVFLCDSKKLFCSIADEFIMAFTSIYIYKTSDGKEKRSHWGEKRYNASHFYKEAIKKEGARLDFLYYLLDQGQINREGIIQGCAFKVPEESWQQHKIECDPYDPFEEYNYDSLLEGENLCHVDYPSVTERCVILDGENLEELYRKLSLLLPHRIESTQRIARVRAEYGDGFIRKQEALENFRHSVSSADLPTQIQTIRNEMSRWTDWIHDNQVEAEFGYEYLAILTQKICILEEKKADLEKEETNRKLEQEKEQKRKNSDNNGEKVVEYEISWFSAASEVPIVSIPADCESKYRYNCILLAKPDFIEENQEYDHILVCSGGVLLIETKHWKGAVEIRSDGKWVRHIGEENRKVGIENPKSQIWRHETLMKAIVPGITVSSVLCFSNADVVIEGKEYFTDYPIIYADQLIDYLSRFCSNKLYSEGEVRSMVQIIESHKVNRLSKQ